LVSYFHHFARTTGKNIARCLSLIIKHLQHIWFTFELTNTFGLKSRILQLKETPIWRSAILNNSIHFTKFDIKNQFTNLNKNQVLNAVKAALNTLHHFYTTLCFGIRNRQSDKHLDHIGHPFKFQETGFTPENILQYCEFELNSAFLEINQECYEQEHGLPMGGFLSAPLACIYTMYMEHTFHRLFYKFQIFRYRDDILAISPTTLTASKQNLLHSKLNLIYGPDLTVELEHSTNGPTTFLEYIITPKLETIYYNKNIDQPHSKHIVRHLNPLADVPRHIFYGTIYGIFKKAVTLSSTPQLQLLSIIKCILEFLQLHYPTRWLIRNINFINLNPLTLRHL
jgi:hypothetical protein